MKLYYSPGTCSLAIRILLHVLNQRCEYESVDLHTKKTETGQDFLKINPKGAVPVLVLDNHETVTENMVIQIYLAEHFKNTELLPALGDLQRYRVLEWLNFISTDLHKGCGPLFSPDVPENVKEEIFRPILKKKMQYVDNLLGEKNFLMGEHFTLPDSYLFVILSWLPHLRVEIDECKNLHRYFAQLQKYPPVCKALEEERNSKKS